MKASEVIKQVISDYILIQAEVTLSIGVIGSIFAGTQKVPYSYFFLPLLIGAICILPCLIIYIKEDLTIKQVVVQRLVELIVLEFALLLVLKQILGSTLSGAGYIAVMVSVLILDVMTYLIKWLYQKRDANQINRILERKRISESKVGKSF